MVHADTLRDYLKFYCGAMHVHACKNEVIIERYCTCCSNFRVQNYFDTLYNLINPTKICCNHNQWLIISKFSLCDYQYIRMCIVRTYINLRKTLRNFVVYF